MRHAPAPAASNTRVAGEKPDIGHAVARNVQHGERRAIERVVRRWSARARSPARSRASACRASPRRRAGNAGPAAVRRGSRKNASTRASRSGSRLARKLRSAAKARLGRHRDSAIRDRARCRRARSARHRTPCRRPPPAGRRHRSSRNRAQAERRVATDEPDPARIAASVAGASTSQNTRIASGPRRFHRAGQQRVIEHADAARLHDDVRFAPLAAMTARKASGSSLDRRRLAPSPAARCRDAPAARTRRARRR